MCLSLLLSVVFTPTKSVQYFSAGDAATILFSSPCIVLAISPLLLPGDRCGLFRTCAAVILFVGVVMISKPPIFMDLLDPAEKEVTGEYTFPAFVCS